ncbi:MAG: sigma-54 dependent transcriptional regulator [bacterium]|nr:sigma-54 dependent transcriptional regulator [bacterium]
METILIVDDEKDLRFNLSNILKDEGYNAIAVGDGRKALNAVKKNSPNLVLLDMKLPEMDGMQILEKMKLIDKDLIIIMLTAYGNLNGAVKAMKLGAFDYLAKPFDNEELILVIKRALRTQYLAKEVETLKKRVGEKITAEELMGESPQIKQVLKQIKIIAPTNMTVILQGESGTGKELIAQMIHQESPRKNDPFIAIDCGAIPDTLAESELFGHEKGAFTGADAQKEGRFEEANGGTLFLDEITNLSSTTQRKLLRVIQERRLQHIGGKRSIKVDVRIIVATNINLSGAVRRGKFREDLFHRLNEFHISLPPLRERKDDIPHLAMRFLGGGNQELNKKIEGFSSDVMKLLLDYPWPGNVRELKNVVRKAVLLCDSNHIKPEHFPLDNIASTKKLEFQQDLDKGVSLKEITKKATGQIEKEAIEQALAKAGGNKSKTAKILKIDRMTLYSKMKEYQIRRL